MIELPVCCLDLRKTPPRPLSITYETDFMLPPQKQTLELHGQGEMCADCAVVWEISRGPGILEPTFGPKVTLAVPEEADWYGELPVATTVVDVYCMDTKIHTVKIQSQYLSYVIFESYKYDLLTCVPLGETGKYRCGGGVHPEENVYNCHGTLVRSIPRAPYGIKKDVESCGECEPLYAVAKKWVLENMLAFHGRPWKVPKDYRTQRAIDLGCRGYGE